MPVPREYDAHSDTHAGVVLDSDTLVDLVRYGTPA